MQIITGLNDNWMNIITSEYDCDITHTIRGLKNEAELSRFKKFGNIPYSYVLFQCRTVGCKYKFEYDPYTYFSDPVLKCPKCGNYNVTSEWLQYTDNISQWYMKTFPEIITYVEFQNLFNDIESSDELSMQYDPINIFNSSSKYGWISASTGLPHEIIWNSEYQNEICRLQLIPRPKYMTSPPATELPTAFKFYGSNDSTSWDLLLDISNNPRTTITYDIDNTTAYSSYKIADFSGHIDIVYESFSSDYSDVISSDTDTTISNNDIKNVFNDEDDSTGWIGERYDNINHFIKWSSDSLRCLKKIMIQPLNKTIPGTYLYCPTSYGVFGSVDDIDYKLILRVTNDPESGSIEHELGNEIYYKYFKIMQFGNDYLHDQYINTIIPISNISGSNSYFCQFYNIYEKMNECGQQFLYPISKDPQVLSINDSDSWSSNLSKENSFITIKLSSSINIKRLKVKTDITSFSNRGLNSSCIETGDINSSGCPSSFDIYASNDNHVWELLKSVDNISNTGSDYIELDTTSLFMYYKISNFTGIEDKRDFSKFGTITASSYYSASANGVKSNFDPKSIISDVLGCMWKPGLTDYDPWIKLSFTNLYILKFIKIISTSNDTSSRPKIKIYGSVDDNSYDLISEQNYITNTLIPIANSDAYLYYKISFDIVDDSLSPIMERLMMFDDSFENLRCTFSYIELATDTIVEAKPAIGVINLSGKTQVSDAVSIYKMKFFKKIITPSYNIRVIDDKMIVDNFYGKIYHEHYQREKS